MTVKFGDLEQGQRYVVTLTDCCVEGKLAGTFLGYGSACKATFDENSEADLEEDFATFDFGHVGPFWGALEFEPVTIP
jgi:hypothetical protein